MADLNENPNDVPDYYQEKLLSEASTSYKYFADNDVLLAKVTPCFGNGKAAESLEFDFSIGIGFGSSEFYVLRCL